MLRQEIWNQLTKEEQQFVQETMAGLRRKGKYITCPHCKNEVKVLVTLEAATDSRTENGAPPKPVTPRPEGERRFLEAAIISGLLDAFEKAVKEERALSGVPSDVGEFFLHYMQNVTVTNLPVVTVAALQVEFGPFLEFYGTNGIVAVIQRGTLKAFLPSRYLDRVKRGGIAISSEASLDRWLRTKHGYVPASASSFGNAIKQRNIGSFGKLVQ